MRLSLYICHSRESGLHPSLPSKKGNTNGVYSIRLVYNYNYNMDRALMTARFLEFETQAFSLSHSLSRCSSDLDPQVVLLLQKAAPACYHIRAPLARALEGGQETVFNEICDLITQTQTRI